MGLIQRIRMYFWRRSAKKNEIKLKPESCPRCGGGIYMVHLQSGGVGEDIYKCVGGPRKFKAGDIDIEIPNTPTCGWNDKASNFGRTWA